MANRLMKQFSMTLEQGVCKLFGEVTTSTSGTVGSQSCKGFTVAKTAAEVGRYTVTLADKYSKLLNVSVVVVGAADAGYTSGKGLAYFIRSDTIGSAGTTFLLQFADAATPQADAELEDSAKFKIEITLKNSSAF